MKNRLQFNRIPALFASGVTYLSGTTMGVSGREKATEALEAFVKRRDFIPLIGEPIVVRYIDDKGKKQAMLAIGKATGSTENDTRGIEYHIIDTAKLQEDIDLANEHAAEALDLASAATHDIANHLVILKNMIGENGIFMEDASFFDGESDDPSKVGLYKNWSGNPAPYETTYISAATNMFEADLMLDAAIKEQSVKIDVLSGVTQETIDSLNELWEAAAALSAATVEFSANTVNEFEEVKSDIDELSAATESFSAGTSSLFDSIIEGTGLNNGERGSYAGHDETHIINSAVSLDNADVLLDRALWAVSGSVVELSAGTVAALEESSDLTKNMIEAVGLDENGKYVQVTGSTYIRDAESVKDADKLLDSTLSDLSANTMAADQALEEKISALENTKGVDAIKVTMSGSDKAISLALVSGEKVLTQDIYGLKTNIDLYYSKDEKKIYLLGADNNVISEVDASDFIKDGMLDHVNVFIATEEDHRMYPQLAVGETYLALYFNTDAVSGGTVSPAFISVKDLVDVYTVSATSLNYLTIKDYEIRANVEDESLPDSLASYKSFKTLCGVTENILAGTGLNTMGTGEYHGHDETHYIKNATSLDNADVKLDEALWALSGVVADLGNTSELEEKLERLSAVTKEFSATTDIKIAELSARTVDLGEVYEYIDSGDTALEERIDEVEEIVAGSLNDLNRRVGTIEAHFNGEYIPLTGYELASGISEDELIIKEEDSVNDAFGKIQKQILDNEETTAAGLNDLSNRLVAAEEEIRHNTGVTALSAAVMSFSAATVNEFNDVHNDITGVENNVTNVGNRVTNLSSFTQYLSAHSLGMLTVNLNGVEQGKYCPSASTTLNLEAIQEVTGADVLLTGYEISTGTTEEELAIVPSDNVNEAFGKVQKQIYDNEAVTAGALNDLDDRITNLSGVVVTLEDIVSGGGASSHDVEVLSGDVISLSAAVVNNQAKIQTLSGDVADCFDGAEYVSSAHTIIFKHGDVTKASIDASAFIKDGMVSAVTVDGTNLVISFNTDAGREDITLPLSSIFNPDNYYNKTEINVLSGVVANNVTNINNLSGSVVDLSGAVVSNRTDINTLSASLIDDELVIAASLNDLNRKVAALSGNAVDLSNYYTKDEVDAKISGSGQFDPTMYYNTANTYNKTEVNNLLSSITSVYSSSTSFSAVTSTSARTSLSATTSLSARTALSATTAKNLDLRYTTANTLANLNFREFLTIATITANTTLSIASTNLPTLPTNGVAQRHVIIENTGSSNVVVTIATDSRVKITPNNANFNQFAIDAGGRGELNVLITYNGSAYTIYVITT